MSETKIWTKDEIREHLLEDQAWLERGVVAIFRRQTPTEQEIEETNEHNGQGFSGFHARSGSYYAKWILDGKHLSGSHLEKAHKMMVRYAGQLARIANKEI